MAHSGAASFGDLEFILIDHLFAKNGLFFSVGRDDLVPPFEGFRVHSSAFGELDESLSDEVGIGELAVFFRVCWEEDLDFLDFSQYHLNGVIAVHRFVEAQ